MSIRSQASRLMRKAWRDASELGHEVFRLLATQDITDQHFTTANIHPQIYRRGLASNVAIDAGGGSPVTSLLLGPFTINVQSDATLLMLETCRYSMNPGLAGDTLTLYPQIGGTSYQTTRPFSIDVGNVPVGTSATIHAISIKAGAHAFRWYSHVTAGVVGNVLADTTNIIIMCFGAGRTDYRGLDVPAV